MEHSFDIKIAKEYGIEAAIILKHLYYWVKRNQLNERHCHEGRYWTYNSIKAFGELFPYLSERQVRYTLGKLKEQGLILVGNFNDDQRNRTLWYTLTDKGMALFEQKAQPAPAENGKSDLPKAENTSAKNGKCNSNNINNTIPLTDIDPDVNTDKGSSGSSVVPACAREQTGDGEAVNRLKSGEAAEALVLWQNNIGTLSPYLTDRIVELVCSVGIVAYKTALKRAVLRNKRNYAYIQTVAEGIAAGDDWGDKPPEHKRQGGRPRNKNDVIATTAEAQRILESGELIDL